MPLRSNFRQTLGSPGQAPDAAAQLQAIHPQYHPFGEHHLHATARRSRDRALTPSAAVTTSWPIAAPAPPPRRGLWVHHPRRAGWSSAPERPRPSFQSGPALSSRHPVETVIVAEIGIHLGVVGPINTFARLSRPPGFLHRLIGGVMPKVNARSRKSADVDHGPTLMRKIGQVALWLKIDASVKN